MFQIVVLTFIVQLFQNGSTNILTSQFRRYNIKTDGCQYYTEARKYRCLAKIFTSADLVAFWYDEDNMICTTCYRNNVTYITFGGQMFWRRSAAVFNKPSGSGVSGLPGILIKLRVNLVSKTGNEWFFLEIQSKATNGTSLIGLRVAFQNSNNVSIQAMTPTWTPAKTCITTVTFQVGTWLDVTVLATNISYVVYINDVFCSFYPYYIPFSAINRFYVFKNITVSEMSF